MFLSEKYYVSNRSGVMVIQRNRSITIKINHSLSSSDVSYGTQNYCRPCPDILLVQDEVEGSYQSKIKKQHYDHI
jgi:hypothetical protein